MSRPEYLHCVMTAGVIQGIRQRQEEYDKDPEAYERRERMRQEQSRWEEENQ